VAVQYERIRLPGDPLVGLEYFKGNIAAVHLRGQRDVLLGAFPRFGHGTLAWPDLAATPSSGGTLDEQAASPATSETASIL